jgi:hypothetical protein
MYKAIQKSLCICKNACWMCEVILKSSCAHVGGARDVMCYVPSSKLTIRNIKMAQKSVNRDLFT